MGGRGGSSGSKGGGGGNFTRDESVKKLDERAVKELEKAIHEVLNDFGLPDSTVTRINGYMLFDGKGHDAIAGANGMDQINLNPKYFSDYSKVSNLDTNGGDVIAGGIKGVATHEVGHVVARQVLKKMMPNSTSLEIAKARKNHKAEKAIIKEAKKRYGSNPQISPYGSTNYSEKVAEAVSDVYTNRNSAKPYSKVIVSVMKDMLR